MSEDHDIFSRSHVSVAPIQDHRALDAVEETVEALDDLHSGLDELENELSG